jgi:DNA-binding NtrC family response regulator
VTGSRGTILIIDDDKEYLQALETALGRDFAVVAASTPEEAQLKVDQGAALVLLDIRLNENDPASKDGLALLESIKQRQPDLPVVMMTAYGDIDIAVEAMKLGAADFIQKARVDVREFRKVLNNALQRSRLERKVVGLEEELRRLEPWELVGDDPKIQKVREDLEMVAQDGYSNVLIRGETGTGKELAARAIHSRGWRKEAPWVAVAISALPRELVETELFGHVKGAFTDAKQSRMGYIEKAKGGVLFLDEIGDLATEVQLKLLRALEARKFARVGSTDEIAVDIQVVCATNRNLEGAIQQGHFRQDLYFRLKTMEICLPPLRERTGDIPLLVDHFLFVFRQQGRTKLAGITPAALERLAPYPFPGNVRELSSLIQRAMMLANNNRHSLIEVSDLPLELQGGQAVVAPPPPTAVSARLPEGGVNLDEELARTELEYIDEALRLTEGKKTEAWRMLGLNDRFALRRRVKRIGEAYPHLVEASALVRSLYYE